MNDRQIDELIDRTLREERQLPEGLSGRLEQYIDALAEQEKPRTSPRRLRWLMGAAAVAAVFVAVFVVRPRPMADTFTDPAEAAAAVEAALILLAANYNEGLDQVAAAVADMEQANEIVFKTLKNEQP